MAFKLGIFGNSNPQKQQQQPNNVQGNNQNMGGNQGNQGFQQNNQGGQGGQGNGNQQGNGPAGGGGAGPAGNQNNGPANSQYQPNGNASNPLDPFVALMTPSKEVVQQRTQQQEQQSAPLFGDQFNSDNINRHFSSVDFMQGANPESVQKALGGDAQAFSEVINAAVRNAVSTSVQASRGMVEHGVKTGTDRFSTGLDSRMRDFQLQSQTAKHPALQHPAGKAMLKSVVRQIAEANPRMSTEEAQSKGEEFFTQFATMLTAKPEGEGNSGQGKQAPDWEAFLEEPQS